MQAFPEAVARAQSVAVRRYTLWIIVWACAMAYLALSAALGARATDRLGSVLGLHGALILTAIMLRGPLKRGQQLGFCVGLSAYMGLTQLGGGIVTLFTGVDHPWPWTVSVAVGLHGFVALRAMLAVIRFRRALASDATAVADTFS
ncbi:MAG: hypothetical protein H6674_10205 [Dehalococcoidia bacterium]|nr:hypothetical protein [Dehalococcoidia bacterium]